MCYFIQLLIKEVAFNQKAIFNSFEQASNGNSRTFESLGLGLSIVKAYIELLNGKIWYKYEKTEDSCFRFTVPYNVA